MAMRQHVKIMPTFWFGHTGKDLRAAGKTAQLVALYLISNPHTNYIGLYRLPLAYARTDLNMTEAALLKTYATLEELGFAKYDRATETVWVLQGARWQIGESLAEKDHRGKFVQSEYTAVPAACPMKAEFFSKYEKAYSLSNDPVQPKHPVQKKAAWASSDEPEWQSRHSESQSRLRDI